VRLLLASLAALLASCAHPDNAALERRVAALEAEVATLRNNANCTRTLDSSVPSGTTFSHQVAFEVGATDFAPGDSITVTEVTGTKPAFEAGGVYQVRGEYVLASADRAEIAFTVTTTEPGVCTLGDGKQVMTVGRGSGKFEVAAAIASAGFPHVYFTKPGGHRGAYFGKDAFLHR
jgi:hypothetical protein